MDELVRNPSSPPFKTMFSLCCKQIVDLYQSRSPVNQTSVHTICTFLTSAVHRNHTYSGVMDFENLAPMDMAWWIDGFSSTLITGITIILNTISIIIFTSRPLRSPTNAILAMISALDVLTCMLRAPLLIYVYILEGYKLLPSRPWCYEYNYLHNFIPSALHSTAFLLNMGLSVQRFVGVRDIRRLRPICSYKGTVAISVVSFVLSASIHSLYPIIYKVIPVVALGKEMLAIGKLQEVETCRITSRYKERFDDLSTSYAWARIAALQLLPGIVMLVCNISLISISYKTYTYRRKLIGAIGTIMNVNVGFQSDDEVKARHSNDIMKDDINQSVVEETSQHPAVGIHDNNNGGQVLPDKKAISVTYAGSTNVDTDNHNDSDTQDMHGHCVALYDVMNHSESLGHPVVLYDDLVMGRSEKITSVDSDSVCVRRACHSFPLNKASCKNDNDSCSDSSGKCEDVSLEELDAHLPTAHATDCDNISLPTNKISEQDNFSDDAHSSPKDQTSEVLKGDEVQCEFPGDFEVCNIQVHIPMFMDSIQLKKPRIENSSDESFNRAPLSSEKDIVYGKEYEEEINTKVSRLNDVSNNTKNICSNSEMLILLPIHNDALKQNALMHSNFNQNPNKHDFIESQENNATEPHFSDCDIKNEDKTVCSEDSGRLLCSQCARLCSDRVCQASNEVSNGKIGYSQSPSGNNFVRAPQLSSDAESQHVDNASLGGATCINSKLPYVQLQKRHTNNTSCLHLPRRSVDFPTRLQLPGTSAVSSTLSHSRGTDNSTFHSETVYDTTVTEYATFVTSDTSTSQQCRSKSSASPRRKQQDNAGGQLRPTVMLVLVTSCTLLAELMVTVALFINFMNQVVRKDFVREDDLVTFILVSNLITLISFPANFIFFYGLSRPFRDTLNCYIRRIAQFICLWLLRK